MSAVVEATDLSKSFVASRNIFGRPDGWVRAVSDVSLSIQPGETLGLVGESGSGKSTTGRLIARLIETDHGSVQIDGTDLTAASGRALAAVRRQVQVVFQDPFSSLDPSWTVAEIITEGLKSTDDRKTRTARAVELLELVGLRADHARRYPHEFSGGQRQRVAIARALALNPKVLICDEAVSALDVSTQAAVIATLERLQHELGLAYLFISHDLSVVRHLSNRIAVMYLGRIVETAPADELYDDPQHPYSQALLSAVPRVRPSSRRTRVRLTGDLPTATNPPTGCVFHPRCPVRLEECSTVAPTMVTVGTSNVACHHYSN